MDHLWLLTEERPKPSVVLQIIKMYCKDFDDRITLHNEIKISLPAFSKETIPFISISTHGKLELNILHCSFPCSLRYQCVGSSIMNGATALLFIRFLEFQGKSI